MNCTQPGCREWPRWEYQHEGRTERVCEAHQRQVDHHMEALGRTGPLALNPVVYVPLPPRDAPEPNWHDEWRHLRSAHEQTLVKLTTAIEENLKQRAELVKVSARAENAERDAKEMRALLAARGQALVERLTEPAGGTGGTVIEGVAPNTER